MREELLINYEDISAISEIKRRIEDRKEINIIKKSRTLRFVCSVMSSGTRHSVTITLLYN